MLCELVWRDQIAILLLWLLQCGGVWRREVLLVSLEIVCALTHMFILVPGHHGLIFAVRKVILLILLLRIYLYWHLLIWAALCELLVDQCWGVYSAVHVISLSNQLVQKVQIALLLNHLLEVKLYAHLLIIFQRGGRAREVKKGCSGRRRSPHDRRATLTPHHGGWWWCVPPQIRLKHALIFGGLGVAGNGLVLRLKILLRRLYRRMQKARGCWGQAGVEHLLLGQEDRQAWIQLL